MIALGTTEVIRLGSSKSKALTCVLRRTQVDYCKPRCVEWQWQPKMSPDIHSCPKLCLKSKKCPPARFFPRFRKAYVYEDMTPWAYPKVQPKKHKWWDLSFLLPDGHNEKPPLTMCRKLLETRRRKCSDTKDWWRSKMADCMWPAPTEWFGQAVMHVAEIRLPRPIACSPPKPCPPPDHKIPRSLVTKMAICPREQGKMPPCSSDQTSSPPKLPFSEFHSTTATAAAAASTPKPYVVKCDMACVQQYATHTDKSARLNCRIHDDLRTVSCPKHMFTRYLGVDLKSEPLVAMAATTSPHMSPPKEIKKGICTKSEGNLGTQVRSYHTGSVLNKKVNMPEFPRPSDFSHLQPSQPQIRVNQFPKPAAATSAEVDSSARSGTTHFAYRTPRFSEEEQKKQEIAARKEEEIIEMGDRFDEIMRERAMKMKSPIQRLVEEQDERRKKEKEAADKAEEKSKAGLVVDWEDCPFSSARGFHTSATNAAKKEDEEKEKPLCAGCPGVVEASKPHPPISKLYKKCKVRSVAKCPGPEVRKVGELNPKLPYFKCKSKPLSLCNQPRYFTSFHHALCTTKDSPSDASTKVDDTPPPAPTCSPHDVKRESCPCFRPRQTARQQQESQASIIRKILKKLGVLTESKSKKQ